MTKERAIQAVSEALSMGITLNYRGLNGDSITVGLLSAKRSTHKRFVRYEYFLKHSFGEFASADMREVAAWAVDQTGSKLGLVAERQCERFISKPKNLYS